MKSAVIVGSLLVFVVVSGTCAFGRAPKYKKPDVTIPANWQTPAPWQISNPTDHIPKGAWWKVFLDDELNHYEERAMTSNQTLQAALARLSEARASARVTASGLYPELDAAPSAGRQRISGNRPLLGSTTPLRPDTENTFTIPFTLNYEVDLFGRVRRSVEAANETLQATAADLENMRLLVSSELAADYFQLRETDAEIAVVQKAIDFEKKGLDLVDKRHSGGAVSGLDVAQQQTVLDSSVTQLYLLQQQRAQDEHALAVLQGLPASDFNAPVRALNVQPPPIPLGVPSELLQRRPDIATAERTVSSANSQIGVARASFYPNIPLTGGGGVESRDITTLFNAPSFLWSLGLSAIEPLIAGGRLHAQLDFANSVYQEDVANYRESVLVAFQQVEDALAGLQALQSASNSQKKAVDDADRSLDLANARYTGGLVTYLDVITAQELVLTNERLATQIDGQRMVTSVYLIKALGGGWDDSSLAAMGVKASLKQAVQQ
jgi:NodT family efflux transporter outer membrane factor (OMF) lipoprotein